MSKVIKLPKKIISVLRIVYQMMDGKCDKLADYKKAISRYPIEDPDFVKEIEKFAVHDINRFLYNLPNAPNLRQIANFIKCFKKYGGNPDKLGTTIYPEELKIFTRITYFKDLNEVGNKYIESKEIAKIKHVNKPQMFGKTPVMKLIQDIRDSEGSKLENFLEKNRDQYPDLDLQDTEGNTALIIAVKSMKINIVKQLLEYGANTNIQDRTLSTALMYAAELGNCELVLNLLENGARINMQDINNYTALTRAILKRKIKTVDCLLEYGANPIWVSIKPKGEQDEEHLMHGVKSGIPEIAKLLVKHGAIVNNQDQKGFTALMVAVQFNNKNMVRTLLELGADPNRLNIYEETALIMATGLLKDINIIELLIQYGAKINIQNKEGNTPLIFAVNNENEPMIELLLKHGADPKIKNKDNLSAGDYAVKKKSKDMIELIKRYQLKR
jgi:ankyrin repeat protein